MDKFNLPDMSLENDIINKLELSEDEVSGAKKFLEAYKSFKDVPDDIGEYEEDFLPKPQVRKMNQNQTNSLKHVVEEFLNSYIIIGYDMGGNSVEMVHTPTTMSMDAMLTRLHKTTRSFEYLNEEKDYE